MAVPRFPPLHILSRVFQSRVFSFPIPTLKTGTQRQTALQKQRGQHRTQYKGAVTFQKLAAVSIFPSRPYKRPTTAVKGVDGRGIWGGGNPSSVVWRPARISSGTTTVHTLHCCTADLTDVVERHGICLHQYADDSQVYMSVPVSNAFPSAT